MIKRSIHFPSSKKTEFICRRPKRANAAPPKFRTVAGVGNRRWRGRNSGNGEEMETADGGARLGSLVRSAVVEKALRAAPTAKSPPS